MFGKPHHDDEVKRAEQCGWSTETRTADQLSLVLLQGCLPTPIKNQNALLTRPASLDISPIPSNVLRGWERAKMPFLRRYSGEPPNNKHLSPLSGISRETNAVPDLACWLLN